MPTTSTSVWLPEHWTAPAPAPAPPMFRRAPISTPSTEPQLSPEHEREYQLWLAVAKPSVFAGSRATWQGLRGDLPVLAPTGYDPHRVEGGSAGSDMGGQ